MGKRNRVLLVSVSASPMILLAIGTTASGIGAPQVGQALAVLSPTAILDSRSPGARRGGLVQTKLAAAPAQRAAPHERVLSGTRRRPLAEGPVGTAAPSPLLFEDSPLLAPAGLVIAPQALPGGSSLIGGAPVSGPGALIAPVTLVGGGSSGGGGTPSVPSTPSTPVPSVPEPLTWATLLTGLALISARLRHARRHRSRPVLSPHW